MEAREALFKYEVRSDLRGHMEATMALEASKMAVPSNIYIDARVIKVAFIKSDVKFDLQGHWGCLEAAMTSEVTKMAVPGNMHIDARVIEVACIKYDVKCDL